MYYVYILRCNDGSAYTGCTQDLRERFQRHTNGNVHATKLLLPVELIFYFAFKNKYKAFEFEKYLKSGSRESFYAKEIFVGDCRTAGNLLRSYLAVDSRMLPPFV